ncbi:MAG TPA: 50S ribosomal protein L15 [Tepidisphaeraceae bacterium]|jgi:large subunit ribosomal protein L15|nr:50S ribosomal protein L15 [Tepidisphaeraceae bacterium]
MIHELTPVTPRNKHRKRKGRGESSGHGKTSGRGTKGAKARVGTYIKRGHEGGQTPIFRRFPKRGFSNHDFARRFHIVNLSDLNRFENGAVVDAAMLVEAGLVPNDSQPVKVLGDGDLTKKLTVMAGWYSKSAHTKITAAGGTAQNLKGEAFEFPKPKKKFVPREPVKKKIVTEEPAEAKAAPEGKAPETKAEEAPKPAGE